MQHIISTLQWNLLVQIKTQNFVFFYFDLVRNNPTSFDMHERFNLALVSFNDGYKCMFVCLYYIYIYKYFLKTVLRKTVCIASFEYENCQNIHLQGPCGLKKIWKTRKMDPVFKFSRKTWNISWKSCSDQFLVPFLFVCCLMDFHNCHE